MTLRHDYGALKRALAKAAVAAGSAEIGRPK